VVKFFYRPPPLSMTIVKWGKTRWSDTSKKLSRHFDLLLVGGWGGGCTTTRQRDVDANVGSLTLTVRSTRNFFASLSFGRCRVAHHHPRLSKPSQTVKDNMLCAGISNKFPTCQTKDRQALLNLKTLGLTIKNVRTKSQKIDSSFLSVRTHYKFRKIESFNTKSADVHIS